MPGDLTAVGVALSAWAVLTESGLSPADLTAQTEKHGRFRQDLVGAALTIGAEIGAGLRNLGAEMRKRWEMGCPWDNYHIWEQELGCTGSLSTLVWGRISSAPKISSSSLPPFADWLMASVSCSTVAFTSLPTSSSYH